MWRQIKSSFRHLACHKQHKTRLSASKKIESNTEMTNNAINTNNYKQSNNNVNLKLSNLCGENAYGSSSHTNSSNPKPSTSTSSTDRRARDIKKSNATATDAANNCKINRKSKLRKITSLFTSSAKQRMMTIPTAVYTSESGQTHIGSVNSLKDPMAAILEPRFKSGMESRTSTDTVCSEDSATPAQAPQPPMDPPLLEAYEQLYMQCREHAEYFSEDSSEKGQRLHAAFVAWQDFIVMANKLVLDISKFACLYDFDADTPGNGYRSFITCSNASIYYGLTICQNLTNQRSTMFFRKKFYMKEVEACSQLLSSLCTILHYLLIMHEWSKDSEDLFARGEHSAEELFEMGDTINQYCFYGRCLGYQYGDSLRGVVRFLAIGMASFSESFYSETEDGSLAKTTRSIWTGGKYFLNPELRARRVVNLSQNAKIDFCKAFWFLAESELMHRIPAIVGSSIKVNRSLDIPAEPLQLPRRKPSKVPMSTATTRDENQNDNTEFVEIPVPSAHLGPGLSIPALLLSYTRRRDMIGEGSFRGFRKAAEPSNGLLFHLHGGGFVAQSPKSHELYLRDWAVALDVPILSVDYSLAPEAPFPRALEEAFYAYCWALKNAELLGTTAERVVLAGDSAGANLSIGVALKCIEYNVRIPDGVFLAYCPTLIQFVPSPARLLCLMDPLIPFGFLMRCLRAYAAPDVAILNENHARTEQKADILNAEKQVSHYSLNLDTDRDGQSASSSRRTSAAKSPLSSMAENSKWEQFKALNGGYSGGPTHSDGEDQDESSDTYASASYRSESRTVERTDLPSTYDDNSSCVSFEDDSQPIEHYPIQNNTIKSSDSEKYIDNFMDKYCTSEEATEETMAKNANDANVGATTSCPTKLQTTKAKTASEENLFSDAGREIMGMDRLHKRINSAVDSISGTLRRYTKSADIKGDATPSHFKQNLRNLDALIARSPSLEFSFQVPKDPFLSPYFAPEEWLAQMPSTRILSLDMDPCLDDCVMFAKKLKSLGRPVRLEVLKGLPHGFLNFTMLSNEAMDGSKRCIEHLKDLLEISRKSPEQQQQREAPVDANAEVEEAATATEKQ